MIDEIERRHRTIDALARLHRGTRRRRLPAHTLTAVMAVVALILVAAPLWMTS